jgi:helix-turn-helix protein
MVDVLYRSHARPIERLVLVALAERAAETTGRCWPSVQDLGARTGLNRTTILRALGHLECRGELTIVRRHRHANQYHITLPAAHGLSRGERPKATKFGSRRATPGVAESDSVESRRATPTGQRNRSRNRAARRPPAAAGTPSPSGPRTGPHSDGQRAQVDARVQTTDALLLAFAAAHQESLGQPYLERPARDRAEVLRALGLYGEATISRTMLAYFADRQLVRFGASVPQWVQRINVLAGRDEPAPRDFTAERFAEEEAAERAAARGGKP